MCVWPGPFCFRFTTLRNDVQHKKHFATRVFLWPPDPCCGLGASAGRSKVCHADCVPSTMNDHANNKRLLLSSPPLCSGPAAGDAPLLNSLITGEHVSHLLHVFHSCNIKSLKWKVEPVFAFLFQLALFFFGVSRSLLRMAVLAILFKQAALFRAGFNLRLLKFTRSLQSA